MAAPKIVFSKKKESRVKSTMKPISSKMATVSAGTKKKKSCNCGK